MKKDTFASAGHLLDGQAFLSGGGETARIILTRDWSQTPLQAIEGWPQALKSSLSLVLQSPLPLAILWSVDGIILYNDAYSRFVGDKHPKLLGSEIESGWPERARFHRKILKEVLEGKSLSYSCQRMMLSRNNRQEEVAADLSFSPILGEDGLPAGVFSIVVENSKQVISQEIETAQADTQGSTDNSTGEAAQIQSAALLPGFSRKPRVLLADAKDNTPDEVRRLLSGRFELLTAEDGNEALSIILNECPDLIIADLQLPGVDGLSLLSVVKENPGTARFPVILLTSRTENDQAMAAGADDIVLRPFSANELLTRASTLIAAKQSKEDTEDRLYQLFRQAPAAVVILSGEKFIVDLANPTALQLWGRKLEQVIGKPLFEALPEIQGHKIEQMLQEVRATGNPVYAEELKVEIDRKGTGKLEDIYFNFVYMPLRNSRQEIKSLMVFAYDVTVQVLAREQARDSEEKYRHLFDTMDQGFCIFEMIFDKDEKPVDYVFLEANPMFEKHTGLKDAVGKTAKELVPELEDEWLEIYGKVAVTGEPYTFVQKSDAMGSRWFEVFAYRLGGASSRKVVLLFTDITERKKTENDLQYHATIAQNIADAVVGTDLDFKIKSWNKSAEKVYGWTAAEVVGKPVGELLSTEFSGPGDSADWVKELLSAGFWSGEVVQKHKNQSLIPILASIAYVKNNRGEAIGAVAVNRDITERKEAEKALRKSEESYRNLFNSIDEGFCIIEMLFDSNNTAYDYLFVEVNPTFERQSGIKDAQGRRMREIAPDHDEHWFEIYGEVALTGKPRRFENHARELHKFFDVYAFRVGDAHERQVAVIFNDITERKLAEQALRKSEEYYKTMTDNTPVMTWVTDKSGSCIFLNKQWYEYTGQSPESAVGYGWQQTVHPEDLGQTQKVISEAEAQQAPFKLEYRLKDAKGNYRWHLNSGLPKFDRNDELEGYVGAVVDIHERKVAEDRLQESEGKFRTLADNISQLAWMADESGSLFWYNQRWFDYTGTSLEDMLGWGWQKVHHPGHVDRVTEKFKSFIENGATWEDTFPLRGKDGKYRWFLSRAIPIRDEEGKILQWFGTNTDVTTLLETEDALKKSEEFSRTLLESSPDCVKALDLKGRLIAMNNNGQRMMELDDVTTLYGIEWTSLWEGDYYESAVEAVEKAKTGGIGHMQGFRPTAKGNPKWWDVLVAPVSDSGGAVERLVCVSRDITEIKELERQKDEFIGIASHELKTPVTSIKGSIQIINRLIRDESYEMVDNFLGKAELHVNKLTGLINDLLDISKIESGKLEYNFTEFDVKEIIEDAVEQVSHQAKKHTIEVKGDLNLPVVGDKVRLEQVVSNLLSNAIKYSPDSDKVAVEIFSESDMVRIAVTDFGIGIPAEKLDKVFERFFRVEKSSHQFQGLGLGLYICAEIVKRHGGKLAVSSTEGKGSTFSFSFPTKRVQLN